jgi:predicted RNA binding protein YcfA (HicA-like mRNA interferase family)
MPSLRQVSGQEAIRALERLGFVQARQRGSHVVLKKVIPEGVVGCVVPLHTKLAIGTLRGVLKQADVSPDEFMANL